MKKRMGLAAAAVGVGLALTACGGGVGYANSSYCVNEITGQVMPSQYCQVGSAYYNPAMYDLWVGSTYGHSYRTGMIISHSYFTAGKQVNPSNSSARAAAGLPVRGSVGNGTSTTPARPQTAPKPPGATSSVPKVGSSTPRTSPPRISTPSRTGGSLGGFRSSFGRK